MIAPAFAHLPVVPLAIVVITIGAALQSAVGMGLGLFAVLLLSLSGLSALVLLFA